MDPPPSCSRTACSRLPRTRGDGPSATPSIRSGRRASPHTRGWTSGWGAARPANSGFPAHAGMDPPSALRRRRRRRLPRTRGDGPNERIGGKRSRGASPHTRGWTLFRDVGLPVGIGFPAHAGMDPSTRRAATTAPGLPRTRGDGPSPHGLDALIGPASPHTRGWTVDAWLVAIPNEGFPAHAGMDLALSSRPLGRSGLPRTRGDGPPTELTLSQNIEASPHTRGWTGGPPNRSRAARGFPAHAGMDP